MPVKVCLLCLFLINIILTVDAVQAGQLSVEGVNEQVTQSAITSSISAFEPNPSQQFQLGPAACYEIDRIILTPILNEERLRPFFDLVKSIPQRIANNEIQNLRDLEKTLLWLTPVSGFVFSIILAFGGNLLTFIFEEQLTYDGIVYRFLGFYDSEFPYCVLLSHCAGSAAVDGQTLLYRVLT